MIIPKINKTTGIISSFVILLMTIGYTTNSFSQPSVGNITMVCDPDEVLNESGVCVPKNSNGTNTTGPGICDPDEVLVNGECKPKNGGTGCGPNEVLVNGECKPRGTSQISYEGFTTNSMTTTTISKGNKLVTTTIINITSVVPK